MTAHHPAALRVWEGAGDRTPLLFADWPRAAEHAAWLLRRGKLVHLEWVPCAVSPLGQLVPLVSDLGAAPSHAHRAWVLVELDATGAVHTVPSSASSGVL